MNLNINDHINTLTQVLLTLAPHIFMGILVFLLIYLAATIVNSLIVKMADHSEHRKYLLRLLGRTSKITLILIAVVSGLGTMGINVTALVTSLGLVGFALSFALKDSLSNLIAGFMILFYRPFLIGDTITVSSISGTVEDINLRYTIIHTDSTIHMVPNSSLINNIVSISMSKL